MEFLCTPFQRILQRWLVIELLAKSILENKEEVRVFSSMNDEIGFEKYFKRTIKSLEILDAFRFCIQKISDNFRHSF